MPLVGDMSEKGLIRENITGAVTHTRMAQPQLYTEGVWYSLLLLGCKPV